MPRRTDIHKILIIGSGPAVIGQAGEYDAAATEASRTLRSLGYEVIIMNPDPSAVSTFPASADSTYLEPLDPERLAKVIGQEKPDAILPTFGGQAAMNLCDGLAPDIRLLGVTGEAVSESENRANFRKLMKELGIPMARGEAAKTVEEALAAADRLEYPVVVRSSFTTGGQGTRLVYNRFELRDAVTEMLTADPSREVVVEECLEGYDEFEMAFVRDEAGTIVMVCGAEQADACGIHAGDSLTVSPMQAVPKETAARARTAAEKILGALKPVGAAEVRFAAGPDGNLLIIGANLRVSRLSSFAERATGFPIAAVSAKLAAGLRLAELPSAEYGSLDHFEPKKDFVAVRFPRWTFEKFQNAEDVLTPQMHSVGASIAFGANVKEALQKAVRSLGTGRDGFGFDPGLMKLSKEDLLRKLVMPSSDRYFVIYEALRKGATVEEIADLTRIKPWYLGILKELCDEEQTLADRYYGTVPAYSIDADADLMRAKADGFGDRYLARVLDVPEEDIRERRMDLGVVEKFRESPVWGMPGISLNYGTCSGDPHDTANTALEAESGDDSARKILLIGGGANHIGQSTEFDYSLVRGAEELRRLGFTTIIVNCSPEAASTEAVSTNAGSVDKLYIAPLDLEDVLEICEREKPLGVITQFGGHTPLRLAVELKRHGIPVLGTDPEYARITLDQEHFLKTMRRLNIPTAADEGEGFFPETAVECEANAVSDGTDAFIPALTEQIELAGIHSGDSACIIPPRHIPAELEAMVRKYMKTVARELHVVGLLSMKFAVEDGEVMALRANFFAARLLPVVEKVSGVDLIAAAADILTGKLTFRPSPVPTLSAGKIPYYGAREAVFPFHMFPEVDPILSSEMRSTGAVLTLAADAGEAFYKAEEAAGGRLPLSGTVLISLNDRDKSAAPELARKFSGDGFRILATGGTYRVIRNAGIPVTLARKIYEGRPNILDLITNGKVDLIVNTPFGTNAMHEDSYLRKSAIGADVAYITTVTAARAAADGIHQMVSLGESPIRSLQEWNALIRK